VTESIALLQNPDFISKKTPNGDLVPFLTKYEWDLWASVRFGHKFQLLTVGQKIKNLYSHIQKKFKNIEIRLFFVTETNPDLTGYHAHFLFWTDSPLKTEIRSCIENYLRGRKDVDKANTRIEKYIMNGGAIQYMLKETTKNKDGYDFLWNKYDEKFA
jgi:hypothetical protein